MYILGISCYYHDASAALLKDGEIVAAAEEERFTRKKHDSSFPKHAIQYCLDHAGITMKDVAHVAFYEKPLLKFERVLYSHIESFPRSLKTFLSAMPSWTIEKLRVPRMMKKHFKYTDGVLFIDHHMAHAASTFLPSPYEKAAIVTIDGVGEWTTTAWGVGEGSSIELKEHIQFPHSIGLLYSTITAYLGFSVNNSEYKVMGLAPYGKMDRKKNPYYEKLRKVISWSDNGAYALDMDYFVYHYKDRMPSRKLCKLLGGPIAPRDSEMTQRHKDIAAALQLVCEDVVMNLLTHVHKVTKCDSVVLAGGVALNSVANGKILRNTPFKKIWIQPNASDGGTSMGAALYAWCCILGKKRSWRLENAYFGPSYTHKEVKEFLDSNKIAYKEMKTDTALVDATAKLLADNNVIGWFQGRMEWGPRALGSRSILANPANPDAQELLNTKVKHREKFRPFAPVVCENDALTYFDCDTPLPEPTDFMLMVYPIKEKWHKKIPAVTHVDGSGRLQSVRRHQNEWYYDLIKAFGKLTGVPILINTSFNIRGEPIVCSPYDAYRCMMGTQIDYLVMDRFIVKRDDNLRDAWDSEKLAKD